MIRWLLTVIALLWLTSVVRRLWREGHSAPDHSRRPGGSPYRPGRQTDQSSARTDQDISDAEYEELP